MPEEKTPEEGGKGGEFTPITSQDDLNRIIGERIARERGKYADYDDLKAKAEKFDQAEQASKSDLEKATTRAEAAEAKVQQYEQRDQVKTWAAEIVKGSAVPADLLASMSGSSREDFERHFESLKPHFTKEQPRRVATPAGKQAGEGGESRAVQALRELRGTA